MQPIYPKIQEADLIIFGTPLYWYGPSGKMKLFVDRLRPFVASEKLKGKKGVIVTPSAEGPQACEPLIQMFRMSFEYLGIEFTGEFLAIAYENGEIGQNQEVLKRAYEFGANSLAVQGADH
jgi:multimeric flavodoxin WrbA